MHIVFFLRGKFEQVELFKAHAQAVYWKWRRINLDTKKEEVSLVQGALRPTLLGAYEYIFPREALAEVCSMFGVKKNNPDGMFGAPRYYTLRKMFGCKKIPKDILKKAAKIPDTFQTEEFERGVSNCIIPGVAFHLVGIKDDPVQNYDWGKQGRYYQEGL